MNILIAPNSFKHAATAGEVSRWLRDGIKEIQPTAIIDILPMADGGPGTVEAILETTKGRIVPMKVQDPLGRETDSFFGITRDKKTAVIEMAAASGIELLKNDRLNPMEANTFGTGQLIKAALDKGCRKILIGIGGSATIDGGMGMAAALGVKFSDRNGKPVRCGGGYLKDIYTIDVSTVDQRIYDTDIQVACDVTNPLTGAEGAAFAFGPQKGADLESIRKLDDNLTLLATKIREFLHIEVENIQGTGAAGGLGAGLIAFCRARLMNGFEMIAQMTNLENKIERSDLIVTGEGKIDRQTLQGKTVGGIARLAKKHGKPLLAVAGSITEDAELLYKEGVSYMFSILRSPVTLSEGIQSTQPLLKQAGRDIGRLINYWDK